MIALLLMAAMASPAGSAGQAGAPVATDGEALFARHCSGCHLEGGWGTRRLARRLGEEQPALLLRRKDLDPDYVAFVVRNGVGPMPPFTPVELSAEEVRAIAAFVAGTPAR